MNYSEQLKSPMWQKKRLEIMQRDNFTCQNCGDENRQLQVHHKHYIYGNNVWEYDEDELVTLCSDCHEGITLLKKEVKEKIDTYFTYLDSFEALSSILDIFNELDPSDLFYIKDYLLDKYIYKNA